MTEQLLLLSICVGIDATFMHFHSHSRQIMIRFGHQFTFLPARSPDVDSVIPQNHGIGLWIIADGLSDSFTKQVIFTGIFHNRYDQFLIKVASSLFNIVVDSLDHVLLLDFELISFVVVEIKRSQTMPLLFTIQSAQKIYPSNQTSHS